MNRINRQEIGPMGPREGFDAWEQREALSRDIAMRHPLQTTVATANSLRLGPGVIRNRLQYYQGPGALNRIRATVTRLTPVVDQLEAELGQVVPAFSQDQDNAIRRMLYTLRQDGPDDNGTDNKEAVYLLHRRRRDRKTGQYRDAYSVNLGGRDAPDHNPRSGIRPNQAFLRQLLEVATSGVQQQFLTRLIGTMDDYARSIDPRETTLMDYKHRSHNRFARREQRRMGRMLGTLALSATGVTFGTISLASGNVPTAGLLYLLGAAGFANGGLPRGKMQNDLLATKSFLDWNKFRPNARKYRIGGDGWAGLAETAFTRPKPLQDYLRKPTDENGMLALDAVAPEGSAIRPQVIAMMRNGDFIPFIEKLQTVRGQDPREFVRDYIATGASQLG